MVARSLHTRVVDALGERIVAGRLAPGSTFTTADVEREFQVSRSVAREAIRVLESLGLVRASTRVGSTVQPSEDWNVLAPQVIRWRVAGPERRVQLQALTELRSAIEPVAARFAARRASSAQVREMVRAAEEMVELGRGGRGDSPEFLAADVVFHSTMLQATGNDAFCALVESIIACLEGRNAVGLTPADPAPSNLERHRELATAIGRRDEDAAEGFARGIVSVVRHEID